jgi:hypothetical protein
MSDPINHPAHYTTGEIECVDAIHAALGPEAFVQWCRGNAFKYLWRLGKKGPALVDAQKARWYINRAISEMEQAEGMPDPGALGDRSAIETPSGMPDILPGSSERAMAKQSEKNT